MFGGIALCGDHKCNNVIVHSHLPPSFGSAPYSREYLGYVRSTSSGTRSASGTPRTCSRART